MSGLELSHDIFLLWLAFLKTQLVLWHSFVVHSTIRMDVCPHGWGSDRQGTRVERNKSGVVQDYTCIPAIAANFVLWKPVLNWVGLILEMTGDRKKFLAYVVEGGISVRGEMKSLTHVGHRLHFAYVTLAGYVMTVFSFLFFALHLGLMFSVFNLNSLLQIWKKALYSWK